MRGDTLANKIDLLVKRKCLDLLSAGQTPTEIYHSYFSKQFEVPASLPAFERMLRKWKKYVYPDRTTLEGGTYEGFIAHGATVQVTKDGEIVQAWIKQSAGEADLDAFLRGIRASVERYDGESKWFSDASGMLEIPLFDMHWGISYFDDYKEVLDSILSLIRSRHWEEIVIPVGQDYFHNDSIEHGITSNGTKIEKVDMERAVKDAKKFAFSLIDTAIENSSSVKVLYSPGNHDRSISWMFIEVLLERYGEWIVDDSIAFRKCITYGKNAVMITHGDSKQASARNLASIFPVSYPAEFAMAAVREVHAGHLHEERDFDVFGVMVRRLSHSGKTDKWADKEDYVGSHKRFMLFHWGSEKLEAIYYI